ncbi:MAG: hypothetical protein WAO23_03015 [Dethiobacteria bacterium]
MDRAKTGVCGKGANVGTMGRGDSVPGEDGGIVAVKILRSRPPARPLPPDDRGGCHSEPFPLSFRAQRRILGFWASIFLFSINKNRICGH